MARGDGGNQEFELEEVVRGSSEDDSFKDLQVAELASRLRQTADELEATSNKLEVLDGLAQKVMTICRVCREVPADFILWGKLFHPDVQGPCCWDCAKEHVDGQTLSEIGRSNSSVAALDLQPYNRLYDRYKPRA